ncbi:MAG: acyl-CoA thioesterase II [Pseudomonadales bacterium]|nr:acyl-CoA thioesterase II [Pseudomonadales bacterium]
MSGFGIDQLIDLLRLEQIEKNMFRGRTLGGGFVFGGQVLGQALMAASQTVEADRMPHSLHSYFLRAGDSEVPILFEVDRIRDGKSFTTRRVVAIQHGKAIFNMAVSFQVRESGFEHQTDMPIVSPPEGIPSDRARWEAIHKQRPELAQVRRTPDWPVEMRHIEWSDPFEQKVHPPYQHVWIKALGDTGEDQVMQRALLAFASDMGFMGTTMRPHVTGGWGSVHGASLDHSIWFHHDIDFRQWHLYENVSPWAADARGYVRGAFYTEEGRLVASTTQECLIRPNKK